MSGRRVWLLALSPLLCVVGGLALVAALALTPPDARQHVGLGTSLLLFFALTTLPGYALAALALRRRLLGWSTGELATVVAFAALLTPLAALLAWRVAPRLGAGAGADALFFGGPPAAGLLALPASVVAVGLVRHLRAPRAGRRGVAAGPER